MSCEECARTLQIDGVDPPCFGGVDGKSGQAIRGITACWIPELDEAGSRIMEMREKLITLGELVGRDTIMRIYEATKEDLELLEAVENEFKKAEPGPRTSTHG